MWPFINLQLHSQTYRLLQNEKTLSSRFHSFDFFFSFFFAFALNSFPFLSPQIPFHSLRNFSRDGNNLQPPFTTSTFPPGNFLLLLPLPSAPPASCFITFASCFPPFASWFLLSAFVSSGDFQLFPSSQFSFPYFTFSDF